jgi:hypothetical protein
MNVIYESNLDNNYNDFKGYCSIKSQLIKNINIIKNEPSIYIDDKKNNFYSVILIDLDSSFLHWWISNYNLKENYFETWVNYLTPFDNNNETHRYIFYLFSQDYFIHKPEYINPYKFRVNFNVKENIEKLNLKLKDTKYFLF